MKPELQPLPDPEVAALRHLVNRHVFELIRSVSQLRIRLREVETGIPLDLRTSPALQHPLNGTRAEIDRIHDTMIRLRWAAFANGAEARPQQQPTRAERSTTMPPRAGTVFIVDDDASVRRALSRLFRSVGYEAETFASAKTFLESGPDASPGCIVLDVRMPRMSGLDLQVELASQGADLPIIFITGHGDIDMAVKAMKDGAIDFLPKPFDDQDLLDSVSRALQYHGSVRTSNDRRREVVERFGRLTQREREVFERVVKGMLNKQIGFELGTTEKTVKVHRSRVMEKMEAESLADLVRMASQLGIEGPAAADEE